jgi:ABC-type Zn uptake system ZnuABC Zn-binding protein ZnuA
MKVLRSLLLIAAAAALLAAACSDDDDGGNGEPTAAGTAADTTPAEPGARLVVITTVSPITSIAEAIGCGDIDLEGIVPEGVNSHTFEPAPSVAQTLAEADIIFINGLTLEEPTKEMAQANMKDGAVLFELGNNTITEDEWQFDFSFPESEGNPNPHLWPNPLYGLKYAELIRDELIEADPENADAYNARYDELEAKVNDLDQRLMDVIQTIPENQRQLLTYHDSWAYFAPRYGLTVVGAVQPSDFAEPSAQEVADLIDQVNELQLPAIFGSEVFPSDVLQTIADETGAEYVDDLRDDDLPGAPGDPDHTYLGLIVQNMEIMVPALGGNVDALDGFDPALPADCQTEAVYPQ